MAAAMIQCPACGEETFLRREPVYDGFVRTGETLSCVGCGHVFAREAEIPFVSMERPKVFSDADRSKKVEIFTSSDRGHTCRHCRHYVTNPFVQRCGLHQIEVQATDCCPDFSVKTEDEEDDPLSKLLGKKGHSGHEQP